MVVDPSGRCGFAEGGERAPECSVNVTDGFCRTCVYFPGLCNLEAETINSLSLWNSVQSQVTEAWIGTPDLSRAGSGL
ncbi:unnamed protein product [Lampetra planeri]